MPRPPKDWTLESYLHIWESSSSFFNQSARPKHIAGFMSSACSSPLHRACLVNCFTVDVHLGWCEDAGQQHWSRLIYLNVFEFDSTFPPNILACLRCLSRFYSRKGREILPLLTWIYGISLAELKPLLASQDVNNLQSSIASLSLTRAYQSGTDWDTVFGLRWDAHSVAISVATATQQSVKTQI